MFVLSIQGYNPNSIFNTWVEGNYLITESRKYEVVLIKDSSEVDWVASCLQRIEKLHEHARTSKDQDLSGALTHDAIQLQDVYNKFQSYPQLAFLKIVEKETDQLYGN